MIKVNDDWKLLYLEALSQDSEFTFLSFFMPFILKYGSVLYPWKKKPVKALSIFLP